MNYQGGYLIGKIDKLTDRKVNELLRENGITELNGAQGTILYALWNSEAMTIREIADAASLAKTTLTSMLSRMEKAGLVTQKENPADARSKLIALTEKARELGNVYQKVSSSMQEAYYRGMSEEEISAFETTLRKVLKNLEEYR